MVVEVRQVQVPHLQVTSTSSMMMRMGHHSHPGLISGKITLSRVGLPMMKMIVHHTTESVPSMVHHLKMEMIDHLIMGKTVHHMTESVLFPAHLLTMETIVHRTMESVPSLVRLLKTGKILLLAPMAKGLGVRGNHGQPRIP